MTWTEQTVVATAILQALRDVRIGGLDRQALSKACGYWQKDFSYTLESLQQSGDVTSVAGKNIGTCVYAITFKGIERCKRLNRGAA